MTWAESKKPELVLWNTPGRGQGKYLSPQRKKMNQCLLQMHNSLLSLLKCIHFLLVKGATLKSEENKFAYPQEQIQPSAREM